MAASQGPLAASSCPDVAFPSCPGAAWAGRRMAARQASWEGAGSRGSGGGEGGGWLCPKTLKHDADSFCVGGV